VNGGSLSDPALAEALQPLRKGIEDAGSSLYLPNIFQEVCLFLEANCLNPCGTLPGFVMLLYSIAQVLSLDGCNPQGPGTVSETLIQRLRSQGTVHQLGSCSGSTEQAAEPSATAIQSLLSQNKDGTQVKTCRAWSR
jgi:hypothetical protein